VGGAAFLVPLPVGDTITVGVGLLADGVGTRLGGALPILAVTLLCLSAATTAAARWWDPPPLRAPGWSEIFHAGRRTFAVRVIAAFLGVLTLLRVGPEPFTGARTGEVLLNELIPVLLPFFFFALILLPFLVEFGLMEFIGTLVRRPFRRFFRLPGRSAIDATASWMGAAPIGVIITAQQFDRGYYTEREAAAIATNFSLASIAFALVITAFLGLGHLFVPFYATVTVAALAAAVILPRVPPLSRKRDVYLGSGGRETRKAEAPPGGLARTALAAAVGRAHRAPGPRVLLRGILLNLADIYLGLIPLVMVIGTGALAAAEYTPLFTWLSYPMVPVLEWLRLPEADAAAAATLVGFADMFLPAVLLSGVESELTRFVVGCLSLTQLVYLSEVGVLILKSRIPLGLGELVVIFLLRTAITLPIIAGIAHAFVF
jgi:nucleoside recognition membrane protein YjiH